MRNPALPRNVTVANEKLEPGMYTYRLGRKKFHGQSVGQVREVTRRLYSDENYSEISRWSHFLARSLRNSFLWVEYARSNVKDKLNKPESARDTKQRK